MLRNRYVLLFVTVLAHMVALTLDLQSPWMSGINLLVARFVSLHSAQQLRPKN